MRLSVLLAACTPTIAIAPSSRPMPVAITVLPTLKHAGCLLEGPPNPPKEIDLSLEETDVIQRTTVHIGQYNAMRKWAADVMVWVADVNSCLRGNEDQ
jgi:hypothetical protein